MHKKLEKLLELTIFKQLSPIDQQLVTKDETLSFQELRMMCLMVTDAIMWQVDYRPALDLGYKSLLKLYTEEQNKLLSPIQNSMTNRATISHIDYPPTILGHCPVNSIKTRCCGLKTLDTAQGCGFACAYCAIPTFYGGPSNVRLPNNLAKRLEELELDPKQNYHIGTGQASDSLLYCSSSDADALITFAKRYPNNLILEFKSKASNISSFLNKELAKNIIFSWSVNPQIAINAWEGQTASLDERLEAAQQMVEQGALIAFHLHPIIPFEGYERAYQELVERIIMQFNPRQIAFISLGTLTFSKANLKHLRAGGVITNILKLPLTECAGKYSLPIELKKKLFTNVMNSFKIGGWDEEVFFYLCMEDDKLWLPVLGYEYESNDIFEEQMFKAYYRKIDEVGNGG